MTDARQGSRRTYRESKDFVLMRRPPALALLGLALGCCGAPALAAKSETAPIRLDLRRVDALSVSDPGPLDLRASAGNNLLTAEPDSSSRLSYSHNSSKPRKISAELQSIGGPHHDITLSLSVAGGSGRRTLLLAGVPQPSQDVYAGIEAGALAQHAMTYEASCTASGTRVSGKAEFSFWVVFTSTD